MPNAPSRVDLQQLARQIMAEHGFEPDFPKEVTQQVSQIQKQPPSVSPDENIRDLRNLL